MWDTKRILVHGASGNQRNETRIINSAKVSLLERASSGLEKYLGGHNDNDLPILMEDVHASESNIRELGMDGDEVTPVTHVTYSKKGNIV